MPHLHKRFSSPPDQLVSISDVPSGKQVHQCPFKRCPICKKKFHICSLRARLDPGKEHSHSKEGSAKMSCVVQQTPSKNKPCGIYGDEGFQSLQWELKRILTHYVPHKIIFNVHRFTSLACSKHMKNHHITPHNVNLSHSCTCTAIHSRIATVPLTLPAEKVTIGRKMMPSFASGTFVQTAASTAITAPDWWNTHRENISGEKCFGLRDS